jgi:methyl-accepting chemotaxis protein
MFVVFGLQLIAFAAAGVALFTIIDLDLAKDFYSAHRSIKTARDILLPATLVSGGAGFVIVALATWMGFRIAARRLTAPIQRADTLLQRLSKGDLTYSAGVVPQRERSTLDDSADALFASFRDKIVEMQRLSKDVHNTVLSLRYKATGSEQLTLKELREVTGSIDLLCKKLSTSIKWFET